MILRPRRDGPMIWAHAATPAALDAILEVLLRAQVIEPSLSYVLSAPASEYVFDSEVVRLQEPHPQSGQNFLKKTSPDLCLWVEDSINTPLFGLIQKFSIQTILINVKT